MQVILDSPFACPGSAGKKGEFRDWTTIKLAVSCSELYFARYCDLKRTGTFASDSKVKLMCLF